MAKTNPDDPEYDPECDPTGDESRRGEEIDLSPEEEAMLDRAWERTCRWEALRRLQQQSEQQGAATNEAAPDAEDEDEEG